MFLSPFTYPISLNIVNNTNDKPNLSANVPEFKYIDYNIFENLIKNKRLPNILAANDLC